MKKMPAGEIGYKNKQHVGVNRRIVAAGRCVGRLPLGLYREDRERGHQHVPAACV